MSRNHGETWGTPLFFLRSWGKYFHHTIRFFSVHMLKSSNRANQNGWGTAEHGVPQVSLVRRTEHNKQREALDYDCATLVFAPNFPS